MPFTVSELGDGCSRLGSSLDHKNDKEEMAALLSAFERGVTFFDTADTYAQGRSERLLGQAFKERRARVIFATKLGYQLTAVGRVAARLKPFLKPLVQRLTATRTGIERTSTALREQHFSPEYIRRAIDGSLRRLQTDYLDVIQLHNPSPEIIKRGEFIAPLEQAKAQGKIKCYGISCRTAGDATFCLDHPGISSVQIPVNLLDFEKAISVVALARDKNIAVIARQPLASGYLARPVTAIISDEASANSSELRRLSERTLPYQFLNRDQGRTIAQAAIRFVLGIPGVSVVITGMSKPRHVEENLASATCSLTDEELSKIYAASAALQL